MTARPQVSNNHIGVSVLMSTYNHERYIAQAIESVITQKTNFNYELVILDDFSEDRTRQIIKEFQGSQPEIIRAILLPSNRCDNRAFAAAFLDAPGKYIALIDGDDYWTSEEKLQKQFDFLDTHCDCVICFHNAEVLTEDMNKITGLFNKNQSKVSTLDDLWGFNFIAGCSPMIRSGVLDSFPEWYYNELWGDWPLYVLCAEYGDIGYIDETLGVYRVHRGGYWSGLNESEKLQQVAQFYRNMNANLNFRYDQEISAALRIVEQELAETLGTSALVFHAVVEPLVSSIHACCGENVLLPVRVINRSSFDFHHRIGLSYHLFSQAGEILEWDNSRTLFNPPLHAGEERVVNLGIRAPANAGTYCAEIDIVWDGVAWFKDRGSPTTSINLSTTCPEEGGVAEQ